MKSESGSLWLMTVGFAALVVAGLCVAAWWMRPMPVTPRNAAKGASQARAHAPQAPVELQFANRTAAAEGFPSAFCEHQTPSVRGTAAYALALADPARKPAALAAARASGARVIGILPPNAILVETSAETLARLKSEPQFTAASEWLPADKIAASLATQLADNPAEIDATVVALAAEDVETVVARVVAAGGARITGAPRGKTSALLRLPRSLVPELAASGDVRWLEPFARPQLMNADAVKPQLMNVQTVWNDHGLTGRGQLVTTSDSGLDTGDIQTLHEDLRNQIAGIGVTPGHGCTASDPVGHGTHTAGAIVGDGTASGGSIRGTAWGARLWVWCCNGADGFMYQPETYDELFRPAGAADASVHSASWGYPREGSYNEMCHDIDEYVWEHPDFLPIFANGNEGWDDYARKTRYQSVSSPAAAKNVIAVGATQNLKTSVSHSALADGDPTQMSNSSSRGPCADGRIKPDVCAPGNCTLSTRAAKAGGLSITSPNPRYTYNAGTSMAAPLVAGAAAVVRQWLVERRGFGVTPPSAALVKAVLTGGAKDCATPDNDKGWGRVDLGASLYPGGRAVRLVDRIPFSNQSEQRYEVTLNSAAAFDAQLVWIDAPATEGARSALVNDLDLVVSNKATHAVWTGNGVAGGDHVNTVESVRIASAPAGDYVVFVRGHDVSYPSTQGGAAALYLRGAFTPDVTEPTAALAISGASPTTVVQTMKPGATKTFSVTVAAPAGVLPTYKWTVDGEIVMGETGASFTYAVPETDVVWHSVAVTVSAPNLLPTSRAWTVQVSNDLFVDAATGDDATGAGTEEKPFATIAAALKKAKGGVIYVGPGAYAGPVAPLAPVRIVAREGAEATRIDGKGKTRCFDASNAKTAQLEGFTLTNGVYETSWGYGYGGGALNGVLKDCVIVDCHARKVQGGSECYGGGVVGATLIDCRVESCSTVNYGGGIYYCSATGCVIRACWATDSYAYGGGASYSTLVHCTVVGNAVSEEGTSGGVDAGCTCVDSIVWGNVGADGETSNWEARSYYPIKGGAATTYFRTSCTEPTGFADGGGNVTSDPQWVDAAAGDFRLWSTSPCIGKASDQRNMGASQEVCTPEEPPPEALPTDMPAGATAVVSGDVPGVSWANAAAAWAIGTETVVVFTNVVQAGAFTVEAGKAATVNYLAVGGGGAGGSAHVGAGAFVGAGGGAGAFVTGDGLVLSGGVYTVAVGKGGAAQSGQVGSDWPRGENGGASSMALGDKMKFEAVGGGAGGTGGGNPTNGSGCDGGSGGGACYVFNFGEGTPGAGVKDAGFGGASSDGVASGGGGGGAGEPGARGVGTGGDVVWIGGKGGDGRMSSITGNDVWYAGGGGGGCNEWYAGAAEAAEKTAAGGKGGGGTAHIARGNVRESKSGTDQLGGGGAGACSSTPDDVGAYSTCAPGRGGNGVVVIRVTKVAEGGIVPIGPGGKSASYGTKEAAEADLANGKVAFEPSDDVKNVFAENPDGLTAYKAKFVLNVVPEGDKWVIAAEIKPEAWTNLIESAQEATRQIPLTEIASLELGVSTGVEVAGCEPGFYYSLYDGSEVTAIKVDAKPDNRNVLCGADGKVMFPEVTKPSAEKGFFSVGARETRME